METGRKPLIINKGRKPGPVSQNTSNNQEWLEDEELAKDRAADHEPPAPKTRDFGDSEGTEVLRSYSLPSDYCDLKGVCLIKGTSFHNMTTSI